MYEDFIEELGTQSAPLKESDKNALNIYSFRGLPPEVMAVIFAKCSRSPESFYEIAKELTETKSAEFHEKWVVGYGHGSVAEHAVLSIAIENLSILATKVVEDNRLASYTEKSTRYQVFDKNRYYKPPKIMASEFGPLYEAAGDGLFETYEKLREPVAALMRQKNPRAPEQGEKMYETIIKAKTCDVIRYLLPAATLTNLGMTVNARNLEWAIVKLLSNPLEEMQAIGRRLKEVGMEITPTLLKYAEANQYLIQTIPALKGVIWEKEGSHLTTPKDSKEPVRIVSYDFDAENKLVAALIYRFGADSYENIMKRVRLMTQGAKKAIVDESLKYRGPHDRPLRELEHIYYTFDILMDYGAFRDIQRHRIATQTNQPLTAVHGYSTPPEIAELGLTADFDAAMAKAAGAFKEISAQFPDEAQYIVPLAYKKRTLFTWNLRELHHFIPLRSGKKGHPSYRRIAQMCYDKLMEVHPLLAGYINVDKSDEHGSTISK